MFFSKSGRFQSEIELLHHVRETRAGIEACFCVLLVVKAPDNGTQL